MKRLSTIIIITIIGFIGMFLLFHFYPVFYLVGQLIALIFVASILFGRKPVANKLAWILLFALQPIVGIFLYYVCGRNYREIASFKKKNLSVAHFKKYEIKNTPNMEYLGYLNEYEKFIHNMIESLGEKPIYDHTNTDIIFNGDQKFPQLLTALEAATHHIHLEYYIFTDGDVANSIIDILIRKAKEGIKVRLLCDFIGSASLSDKTILKMRTAGIKFNYFGEVFLSILNDGLNYRNHRKIAIIDSNIAFLGGLNIGDEYLDGGRFGNWRDTHLLVEGEAIYELQLVFARDWHSVTGEDFISEDPRYLIVKPYYGPDEGHVQIINDGPNVPKALTKDIYFKLITSAQKYIYIATPYLIPDIDIISALTLAAKSGVDVRILTPSVADHHIIFDATKYNYQVFLESGVKIYQYQEGFMHSKFLIVDDLVASVGSSNLDLRSFHINFELTAIIFKSSTVTDLKNFFLNDDLQKSKEVVLEEWIKRPTREKAWEAFCSLFTPLL